MQVRKGEIESVDDRVVYADTGAVAAAIEARPRKTWEIFKVGRETNLVHISENFSSIRDDRVRDAILIVITGYASSD